jgi:hypothetical protein
VEHYISKDKELPENFINLQTNNGEWFFPSDTAYEYIKFLIGKGKEVPDILIRSMDPTYSLAYAELMVKNDMEIPETIFNRISNRIDHSLSLAETLVENNRPVPEALLESISKDFERAISFVRLLLSKDLEIPETIEKTFATGSTFHAVSYASTMIKANRKVLPAVITNISYDPQSSSLIAEYMFRHNYEDIPEILLQSILRSDNVTREFVHFLKTQTRELPPILNTFVNLSSKGYI